MIRLTRFSFLTVLFVIPSSCNNVRDSSTASVQINDNNELKQENHELHFELLGRCQPLGK